MPAPHLRSRSLRRTAKKLPGGRITIHYSKKKPSQPKCSSCKKPLAGLQRLFPFQSRTASKSQKTVSRAFGGILCPACSRRKIIESIRKMTLQEKG